VVAFLSVCVYGLVSDDVRLGTISRLADLQLVGPNLLNRGLLFDVWVEMAGRMPLFGYGGRMLDTIRSGFPGYFVESPHSLYFWTLLTAGIPGLAALALLACCLFMVFVRICRSEGDSERMWGAVFVAVLVAWLASEYKIDCVRSVLYVDWLLFVLGMPLAFAAASATEAEEANVEAAEGQLRNHRTQR
jgi:O-antigen ligase